MDDSFHEQKRYFQVQLDAYSARPGLHKNKIADCRHYVKVLDQTGSPAAFKEYVQRHQNMLSTPKAEATDRYANRRFLYEKLGAQKKVQADTLRLAVIDQAQTHQELAQGLTDVEGQAQPLEYAENRAIMATGPIMRAVFHLATDAPGSKDRERSLANFNAYWKQLQEADPAISWEKLISYPPYRNRMVFTDTQLATLHKIFAEVIHGSNR